MFSKILIFFELLRDGIKAWSKRRAKKKEDKRRNIIVKHRTTDWPE